MTFSGAGAKESQIINSYCVRYHYLDTLIDQSLLAVHPCKANTRSNSFILNGKLSVFMIAMFKPLA